MQSKDSIANIFSANRLAVLGQAKRPMVECGFLLIYLVVSILFLTFASCIAVHRHFYLAIMMEEKRYPIIEEEGSCMTASDPAVAYATREKNSSGIVYMEDEAEKIDRIPLGMFGFYTDDPKVFEQRVAEMEADMDEIDAGIEDPEKWISSEQMWIELYERHPWLR